MSYISYLPQKGYPDQMSITLMDGRSVRLVEGRHQYGPGIVERLQQTLSSNTTLQNLIASQILRLELDNPSPQHMSMYSTQGQYVGDISTNNGSVDSYYATDFPQPTNQPPPLSGMMSTMPGYYPQTGPIPGVTGAPPYAPVNDSLNQYTLDGVVQPLDLSPNNTVVAVNNADEIFKFQPTPTGNISALRENGQVTAEEESRMNTQQYPPRQPPQQQPPQYPPQQQQYPPQQQQYPPQQQPLEQQQYPPQQQQQSPVKTQETVVEETRKSDNLTGSKTKVKRKRAV